MKYSKTLLYNVVAMAVIFFVATLFTSYVTGSDTMRDEPLTYIGFLLLSGLVGGLIYFKLLKRGE